MTRIERAARALCKFQGLPENTKWEGRPMWESFIEQAIVVLNAADEETSAARAVSHDRS